MTPTAALNESLVGAALQRLGFATILWVEVEKRWADVLPALLIGSRPEASKALLASQHSGADKRSLMLKLARAVWAYGSPAQASILTLHARTEELVDQWARMLQADHGVVADKAGVMHLVFADARGKTRPASNSFLQAFDDYSDALRALLIDLETFCRSLLPAGSPPPLDAMLLDLIDRSLAVEVAPHDRPSALHITPA